MSREWEFRVRPAVFSDLEGIVELAVEMVVLSRSPHRPDVADEEIRRVRRQNFQYIEEVLKLREGGLFVAVDLLGQSIGHVVVLANQVDSVAEVTQAWVYDVSVHRKWWGRGVGRALMAEAEAFTADLGVEWIGLGVTVGNSRAIEFYRELGYEVERYQLIKRLDGAKARC